MTSLGDALSDTEVLVTGTATGGGTTTLVDSSRLEANDRFVNWWLYIAGTSDDLAPEGQERRITDWVLSTTTATVETAFTAAVQNTDTYEIRKMWPRLQYVRAINWGIEQARDTYLDILHSEVDVAIRDQLDYAILSTDALHIFQIYRTTYGVLTDSIATAGAATTLSDTAQTWATSGNDSPGEGSKRVTIYLGTGAGQVRIISSNTATVLTVSVAWTTNPDTTSRYKILRWDEERVAHAPLYDAQIDMTQRQIKFLTQPEEGQVLQIYYGEFPGTLTATTDTTSVPPQYIMLEAMSYLWGRAAGRVNDPEDAQFWARYYHERAEEFKINNPQLLPTQSIWTSTRYTQSWPMEWPFQR